MIMMIIMIISEKILLSLSLFMRRGVVGVVQSSSGVRQGLPLATLYFCSFLQPILETIATEYPELEVHAFIDDVGLTSKNSEEIGKAFYRLQDLTRSKNVELALHKCTWFSGVNQNPILTTLSRNGVQTEHEVVKIFFLQIIGGNNTESNIY